MYTSSSRRRATTRAGILAGLLAGVVTPALAQFALHDGDRVVFYGDSITDNGPYTQLVETFVLTRFPKMNVRFYNAGVGGDRVGGGWMGPIDQRLPRDLFSRKPTVVTVMLGMNDAGYRALDEPLFTTYQNGYRHIADRFKAEIPNARVWLIQPSSYDDVTRPGNVPGGYNAVLKAYSDFVGKLAQERGYGVIDLNTPLTAALTRANEADAATAKKILPDQVHPALAGHLVMAASVVKGWGAPAMVSRTEIDATNGKSNAVGASVKDVKTDGTVRWSSLEEALPFPINRTDPVTNLVLRTTPVEEWIGREIVVVKNLAPGNYALNIDGKAVGTFSADVFSSGIDLSWLDTPMVQQAWRVHDLTLKRNTIMYSRWRNIEFPLQSMDSKGRQEAIKGIDRLNEDLVKRQHEEAKPKAHTFEVVKA